MILWVVLIFGWVCYTSMGKEEMPDFVNNRLGISVNYPGATASEVEYFVIRPIEEVLKGIEGIEEIQSNASSGSANINIYLERNLPNFNETVTEIKNTVLDVRLPEDIQDEPRFRQFKASKKAIIDIAVYDKSKHLLDAEERRRLQNTVISLESRLLSLPEVNSVNRRGFLEEEIRILANPKKLVQYNIPLNSLVSEIRNNNQRNPVGTLEDYDESKVTIHAQLAQPDELKNIIVQGGFNGPVVKLKDIATIRSGFEETKQIQKVNGHEAIILNVVKNSSVGILKSVDEVKEKVELFSKNQLAGTQYMVQLLDDESRDVRNRLELISSNGLAGFILVLFFLFVFLNFNSGLWVALGIPFCFAFTSIGAYFLGFTVNNMTLAGIIIVMGMLVDDAIVVAENIHSMQKKGMDPKTAAVKGARFVSLPITAAIITTCLAFIPMLFFEDRFGNLIKVIPPIIILMLMASLLESLFILPGHLSMVWPRWLKLILTLGTLSLWENLGAKTKHHWFYYLELVYYKVLRILLKIKWVLLLAFCAVIVYAHHIYSEKFKFVLFPNEETTQFRIHIETPDASKNTETAEKTRLVEDILKPYLGKEVVGYRTEIARSRRGRAAQENVASMRVEVVPREHREKSLKALLKEWQTQIDSLSGFKKIRVSTARWGQESGSAIEIEVLDNKDSTRNQLADTLAKILAKHPDLEEAEADRPMSIPEFQISLNREKIKRLGINPSNISQTLRIILEGSLLYRIPGEEEEIKVLLSIPHYFKKSLNQVLSLPVENRGNYLVPLSGVVLSNSGQTPNTIERIQNKRVTKVFANLKPNAKKTPLEIAEELERDVFPGLFQKFPYTTLEFSGEVEDSRDSQNNLLFAVIAVILLILAVLTLLFNSFIKPFVILSTIPIGVAGVIFTFYFHDMHHYGLFAAIGILGLMGVVVNDSIVMLTRLDDSRQNREENQSIIDNIADAAKTRLKAVILTTLTTVAGLFPTAYGVFGYDAMLAEMMLAMGWGLVAGTIITLIMIPCIYSVLWDADRLWKKILGKTQHDN